MTTLTLTLTLTETQANLLRIALAQLQDQRGRQGYATLTEIFGFEEDHRDNLDQSEAQLESDLKTVLEQLYQ